MTFQNLSGELRAKISLSAYKVEDEKIDDISFKCVDVENTSNIETSKIKSDN